MKLKSGTGPARPVRLGEEAVLGREGVTHFSKEGESVVSSMLRTLEILTSKEGIALEIDSVPAGAAVLVDGVELGITPVRASVRAGYRRLDIRKWHPRLRAKRPGKKHPVQKVFPKFLTDRRRRRQR